MKTEIYYKSVVLPHFKNHFYTGQRSYIILKPIIIQVIGHILFIV